MVEVTVGPIRTVPRSGYHIRETFNRPRHPGVIHYTSREVEDPPKKWQVALKVLSLYLLANSLFVTALVLAHYKECQTKVTLWLNFFGVSGMLLVLIGFFKWLYLEAVPEDDQEIKDNVSFNIALGMIFLFQVAWTVVGTIWSVNSDDQCDPILNHYAMAMVIIGWVETCCLCTCSIMGTILYFL